MRKYKILILFFVIPLSVLSQTKKDFFRNLNTKERNVIVNKGTEYPNTGKYNKHFEKGTYHCKACDSPLYKSNSKFESNCGWPSFDDEIKNAIKRHPDYKLGYKELKYVVQNVEDTWVMYLKEKLYR